MKKKYLQFKINPADLFRGPVLILILANLVPLYGVLFGDWKIFPVMLLFWIENVIIGVLNAVKMILVPGNWGPKLAAVIFFCVHYGMFTLGHGVFVFALFGGYFEESESFISVFQVWTAMGEFNLQWCVLALVLSHGISFAYNYLGQGEYKKSNLNQLMTQPYGRVVVLHVTIIIGGVFLMLLGSPMIGLILLLALKVYLDILAHLRQHKPSFNAPEGTPVSN